MEQVFDMCLNYLSYCARTEKEMRDYLKKKSIRDDVIETTIKKLKYYNYVNDTNYTKLFIENNKISKKNSKNKVKFDLKRKGIPDHFFEDFEELFDELDEENFCTYHFKKIAKRTEGVPYKKRLNKITSYLSRKGFSYDLIQNHLHKIEKDEIVEQTEFEKHFNHYLKLYMRKNLPNKERENKLIKALISRGYSYSMIKERIDIEKEQEI